MSEPGDLLYDPTAEPRILATGLAPRLASLEGKRAGILDNSKANAGTLMLAVVARLKELGYLSDERFAEDYTRVRKEHEKFGKRRVQQDLMQKGVGKELVASTLETAYEDVDEVALARQYIARKRMKQPSGANAQKETVRAMNRLLRAGFSSRAIYKVLREWELPEELTEGMEAGGADAEVFAEPEERAGDSDSYAGQNEKE